MLENGPVNHASPATPVQPEQICYACACLQVGTPKAKLHVQYKNRNGLHLVEEKHA